MFRILSNFREAIKNIIAYEYGVCSLHTDTNTNNGNYKCKIVRDVSNNDIDTNKIIRVPKNMPQCLKQKYVDAVNNFNSKV